MGDESLKTDQVVGAVALVLAVLAAVPALAAAQGTEREQPSDTTLPHQRLLQLS